MVSTRPAAPRLRRDPAPLQPATARATSPLSAGSPDHARPAIDAVAVALPSRMACRWCLWPARSGGAGPHYPGNPPGRAQWRGVRPAVAIVSDADSSRRPNARAGPLCCPGVRDTAAGDRTRRGQGAPSTQFATDRRSWMGGNRRFRRLTARTPDMCCPTEARPRSGKRCRRKLLANRDANPSAAGGDHAASCTAGHR